MARVKTIRTWVAHGGDQDRAWRGSAKTLGKLLLALGLHRAVSSALRLPSTFHETSRARPNMRFYEGTGASTVIRLHGPLSAETENSTDTILRQLCLALVD